ncbi:hypothetical protein HHK36_027674 [Tetracentron sinense]|uniref:Uncharacterized protein n=1 Tax=Tetracentron sinense TaxID=13715 RepID=A0A834YHY2_TETSI|nr:hypothetical protein HHK36_027674 [Tetracentron sinense]
MFLDYCFLLGGKINISKGMEKAGLGCRKVLTDVTNSGKQCPHQAPKKDLCKKLDAIAEEQFLHNSSRMHQITNRGKGNGLGIPLQNTLDMVIKVLHIQFSDFPMQVASPGVLSLSGKPKAESPQVYPDLEEIAELPYEVRSPPRCWTPELTDKYRSPPQCRTLNP